MLQPKQEQRTNLTSILLWVLALVYVYVLLLSPPGQLLPGEPVWAIKPETIQEILNESINFFFVLPILNLLGFHYIQAPVVHPLQEALFNFAEAWMLMFLPVMLEDEKARGLPKVLIWGLAMFLTNTFLIPYMALRENNTTVEGQDNKINTTLINRVFGWTGLIVGAVSIIWCFLGRPEFGNLNQRVLYFMQQALPERLTIAFCVDLVLFAIFQFILLGNIESVESNKRWLRFVPFFGMVIWLL